MSTLMEQIFRWFGWKSKAEIEREQELNYRVSLRDANRDKARVRKQFEEDKRKAAEYEKNGEHQKAVAAALRAVNAEKSFLQAEKEVQKCIDIHEMAETQRTLTRIKQACTNLSEQTIRIAGVEEAHAAQVEYEEASIRLEEAREQMELLTAGFVQNENEDVYNTEGEAALAKIMNELQEPEAPADRPAVKLPEIPVPDHGMLIDENEPWMNDRREKVNALMENS